MTQTIQLKSLSHQSRAQVVDTINAAYEGYFVPIYLSESSLKHLIQRESIHEEKSLVAFAGNQMVGLCLLGVRGNRGYVSGMGVIASHRRQGIAAQLLDGVLAGASDLSLKTVQLEVITQNHGAVQLYEKYGFKTKRELLVLSGNMPQQSTSKVQTIRPPKARSLLESLPGSATAWQREPTDESIAAQVIGLQIKDNRVTIAAGLIRVTDTRGSILDIRASSLDAGRAMLNGIGQHYPDLAFTYLNAGDDDPLLPMYSDAGFTEAIRQYEMVVSL